MSLGEYSPSDASSHSDIYLGSKDVVEDYNSNWDTVVVQIPDCSNEGGEDLKANVWYSNSTHDQSSDEKCKNKVDDDL